MGHFSATVEDREIAISNVVIIQDELTDVKENTIMITEPAAGEDFLTGEVLFEAKFDSPEDADAFYALMEKATITTVG